MGMDNGDHTFRTISITEDGERFYQVIGTKATFSLMEDFEAEVPPSEIESDWALPVAFHPAGHELIWEDKEHFNVAKYAFNNWGLSKSMRTPYQGGTITPTPNGLGLIHWQKDEMGIGVYLYATQKKEKQLTKYKFISPQSPTPDGRGIVGHTLNDGLCSLTYSPIDVPLADVTNAWMYVKHGEDLNLFIRNQGLFRGNQFDQLYKLYESENYYCNNYDRNSPTRPYYVTSDIFWELFGSAYQGLFIVKEQDEAIPAFWEMIEKSNDYLNHHSIESPWKAVVSAIRDYKNDVKTNPEVIRIIKEESGFSTMLNKDFAYARLKPRGHYNSNEQTVKYFKAFTYFTTVYKDSTTILKELDAFSDEVKNAARNWISAYSGFIAPSNTPLVWQGMVSTPPEYCQYPGQKAALFPLSWGFDNEVLHATVYQSGVPEELQVVGPVGMRLLPSGLDMASAMGNTFADQLLASDFEQYPPLKKVINNLRKIYRSENGAADFQDNIYNRWINAMATQWLDTVHSTNGMKDNNIWQTKRLQTGLATWATLRHATILVNSVTAAECGEGGFEEILMRAPRGYVEPDPFTFSEIAGLFDYAEVFAAKSREKLPEEAQDRIALYDGIINRLKEAAEEARNFATMAQKERNGEMLNDDENKKILFVARVAEHLFLVFNSIANDNLGLAKPDPIAKIANVAGGKNGIPHLMSAVGNTMEWDHIIPFYGRHQIVKGSIYSYYEFESKELLNDREWRETVQQQEYLPWIKPYVSNQSISGVASTPY